MPFEQVGDQKKIRIEQHRQLREYIYGLAEQAQKRRPELDIRSGEELRAWQEKNRPAIERLLGWPAPIPEYEPHLISEEEIGSDELVRSIRIHPSGRPVPLRKWILKSLSLLLR